MSRDQLIVGLHSVRTALRHGGSSVEALWVEAGRRDRRMREVLDLARKQGVNAEYVDRLQLDKMAPGANHQGVVARVAGVAALDEQALEGLLAGLQKAPFLLVLDGVQDPHNLGACLRSADAAGVDAIITPRDRSTGLTPTACKVACGAAETVPFVQVTNLSRTLRWLRESWGVRLIGTAGEASESLFDTDLNGPLAIVMGGEERGMRRLTRENCDQLVHLPMLGSVESLNVSVTAGICLYEALRQRGGGGVAIGDLSG